MYGSKSTRWIELFDGDSHALNRNVQMAKIMLLGFVAGCAGLRVDEPEKRAVADREEIVSRLLSHG